MSDTNAISPEVAKDLITYLRNQGVAEFEGYGLKLIFRNDTAVNPFQIEDPEERKRAVLEEFKKSASDDDENLYWSTK